MIFRGFIMLVLHYLDEAGQGIACCVSSTFHGDPRNVGRGMIRQEIKGCSVFPSLLGCVNICSKT